MSGRCGAARSSAAVFAGFVAVALLASPPLRADVTWTLSPGQSGDWSTASNWGGALLPTGTDDAYIINGGTTAITLSGAVCQDLYLGDPNGMNGGVAQMSGGGLSVANGEYFGNTGTGVFNQSGGANSGGTLYLANNPGSSGAYNLSGGGQLSAGSAYVGVSGTGAFAQSGGASFTVYNLYFGYNAGSSGTYSLGGSSGVSAWSNAYVGYSGTGSVTQSDNSGAMLSNLVVGANAGSSGTYSLSGSAGLSTWGQFVGGSGTGTVTQSGWAASIAGYLCLGCGPGGNGTFNLGGNGTQTVNVKFDLGAGSGGRGTYNLSGSGQLSAPVEYVGSSGTGTFTQSGGTNASGGGLYLGYSPASSGTYSLSGSGLLSASSESVAFDPAATALFSAIGRQQLGRQPLDRRRRPLQTQRGHPRRHRGTRLRGDFRRRQRPRRVDRFRQHLPRLRLVGECRQHVGRHRRRLALCRPRRIQHLHWFRPLQLLGHHPHDRDHACDAGRHAHFGQLLDRRSGQLPGDHRRHVRHQSQQRTHAVGHGKRQLGHRQFDDQQFELVTDRRVAWLAESLRGPGRNRHIHAIRRGERRQQRLSRLQPRRRGNLQTRAGRPPSPRCRPDTTCPTASTSVTPARGRSPSRAEPLPTSTPCISATTPARRGPAPSATVFSAYPPNTSASPARGASPSPAAAMR